MVPEDASEPLWEHVVTMIYNDSNLNHDMSTGRSLTRTLHSVNKVPICWHSKKQALVKMVKIV